MKKSLEHPRRNNLNAIKLCTKRSLPNVATTPNTSNCSLTERAIHDPSPFLHILKLFGDVLSTMGVSKESINKFLIGNRFHIKLYILSPEICKQSLRVPKKSTQFSPFFLNSQRISKSTLPGFGRDQIVPFTKRATPMKMKAERAMGTHVGGDQFFAASRVRQRRCARRSPSARSPANTMATVLRICKTVKQELAFFPR